MFITFEGLDGSGKTTQIQLLTAFLRNQGYDVVATREPGGTAIGDQIREILHSLKNDEMHPRTELLLYTASRAQLIEQVIKPHLQANAIVLSDRFVDSTLAYQGYGHRLDLNVLRTILNFATGGLTPDVTIYMDISVEEGLKRRRRAADDGEEWNRLDALALAFHKRVYAGYQILVAEEPERWVQIAALGSEVEIHQQIRDALLPRLKQ
ncbi:MAG: dTMP kinase [Chloroflexi bacterium]|nr:dTMP kinase [Chloroflexota bacterium]